MLPLLLTALLPEASVCVPSLCPSLASLGRHWLRGNAWCFIRQRVGMGVGGGRQGWGCLFTAGRGPPPSQLQQCLVGADEPGGLWDPGRRGSWRRDQKGAGGRNEVFWAGEQPVQGLEERGSWHPWGLVSLVWLTEKAEGGRALWPGQAWFGLYPGVWTHNLPAGKDSRGCLVLPPSQALHHTHTPGGAAWQAALP